MSPEPSLEPSLQRIRGSLSRLARLPHAVALATLLIISSIISAHSRAAAAQTCGSQGVAVQVLGSGGPELQDKRASSSYLVWEDGKAIALIDAGGGSALRFGESGADMSQLDAIFFTHFHVDHSADFSALIKSSWFEDRKRPLPIYGPEGNDFMPSATEFVNDFFGGQHGAYRYLSELLEPQEEGSYKMQPHNVPASASPIEVFRNDDLVASAVRVIHGGVPALAWRIEARGKAIVFSGDTNGEGGGLVRLAMNADLFIAHNAVPEGATGVERRLHMPPSVIGQIAESAHVKSLVLSHRMLRTLGKEEQTQAEIRKRYSGPLTFANDLDCFPVK
ncbi:MAG TPA: MBL fold metallo-hydrolase [Candidatus Acidoferrum sp.]|nr:MBL fold metallo-hydrolase [Candidatus Acidoferrum sp.]